MTARFPAMKNAAFWDASALVPLCVHERRSALAQSYFRKLALVVWWGTRVEIHSAVCRLRREEQLSDADKNRANVRFQSLREGWREISPTDEMRALAVEAVENYSLRAGDAFQLAAALVWCSEKPSGRNFVCADHRLAKVAEAAGFRIIQISA